MTDAVNAKIDRGITRLARAGIWMSLFLILTVHANAASEAFCIEPTFRSPGPPEAPGEYRKPVVPSCLRQFSQTGEHSCESHEIAAYFDEVNGYIRKLNDYVIKANSLADDASSFAKDVEAFARCEAKKVKRQHKVK